MKRLNILFFLLLLGACSIDAQTVVDFKNPNVKYMGRIGMKDNAAELTWTASSVTLNFNGTGAKATLEDDTGLDFVTVVVDNRVSKTIQLADYKKEYTVASGLPAGPHKVEIFKRTEYDMGRLLFYKFTLDAEAKILPPPTYKHSIEFYGNSITSGYAIEDPERKDRGTYEYVNGYKSYANLTARHFNAELSVISKSGIGIVISWFPYVMPDIYDRVYALDSTAKWDFKKFTPEVVVVNLFQNDSWLTQNPEHEQFKARFGTTPPTPEFIINAYQKFITSIRKKYPDAKIICALGSMDASRDGSPWPGYIKKAAEGLKDKNIYTCIFPYKNTPGHPSAKEQQDMANQLIAFISKKIKW